MNVFMAFSSIGLNSLDVSHYYIHLLWEIRSMADIGTDLFWSSVITCDPSSGLMSMMLILRSGWPSMSVELHSAKMFHNQATKYFNTPEVRTFIHLVMIFWLYSDHFVTGTN